MRNRLIYNHTLKGELLRQAWANVYKHWNYGDHALRLGILYTLLEEVEALKHLSCDCLVLARTRLGTSCIQFLGDLNEICACNVELLSSANATGWLWSSELSGFCSPCPSHNSFGLRSLWHQHDSRQGLLGSTEATNSCLLTHLTKRPYCISLLMWGGGLYTSSFWKKLQTFDKVLSEAIIMSHCWN